MPGGNYIDGAFFGTTFPHLFLLTFRDLQAYPSRTEYVPRVFGFKVHRSADAQHKSEPLEEWPVRPKDEPMSDWDS